MEPVGLNSVIHKFSSRANILRAATTYGLVKSVQFIFHSHSCEQRIQVGNLETHVAMHLGPFALLSRRFLPTSLQEFVMNHLPWCALGGLFLRCQAGPKSKMERPTVNHFVGCTQLTLNEYGRQAELIVKCYNLNAEWRCDQTRISCLVPGCQCPRATTPRRPLDLLRFLSTVLACFCQLQVPSFAILHKCSTQSSSYFLLISRAFAGQSGTEWESHRYLSPGCQGGLQKQVTLAAWRIKISVYVKIFRWLRTMATNPYNSGVSKV